MKKQTRIISALLAIIMLATTMTVGVSAAYSDYTYPAGYDTAGDPYVSIYQCGSILCDFVDEALADSDLTGTIDAKLWSPVNYDFTSIDKAVQSVHNIFNSGLWDDATGLLNLGALEDININALNAQNCPKRTAAGRYDLEILYALFDFLYDNRTLLRDVVNGTVELGVIESLASLVSALEEIIDTIQTIPVLLKETIFDSLFDEADYPAALTRPNSETKVTGSTIESILNYFVYNLIIDGISFGIGYTTLMEGVQYTVGSNFADTPYLQKTTVAAGVPTKVYSTTYYVVNAGAYVAAPGTTFQSGVVYYSYGRKDPAADPLFPAMWGGLAADALEKGKISTLADYGADDFKLEDISVYDLIRCAIDVVIDNYLNPADAGPDDFSLYNTFMDVDPMYMTIAYGFLNFDYSAYETQEEIVAAFVDSLLDFENGCLSNYIRITDTSITLGEDFYTLLSSLLDLASGFIADLNVYPNIGLMADEDLDTLRAEIAAGTAPESKLVSYLVRIVLSGFIDWCNVPATYVFNGETKDVDSLPEVITFMLIDLASDVVPEYNYYQMIADGEINPEVVDYLNSSVDSAALYVAAGLMRYYLNTYTTMALPVGLDFADSLNHILDWFINKYGGVLNTTAIDSTYTAWEKIDWLLFGKKKDGTDVPSAGLLKLNWLNGIEGSYDLIMNHILCLVNWDFDSFFEIFTANNNGELAGNCRDLVLNLLKRLLSGLVGGNVVIPTACNTLESVFTQTNMGGFIYNVANLLKNYDDKIIASVLPLVASSLVKDGATNYAIHANPESYSSVSYETFLSEFLAQKPYNGNLAYDEDGYEFYGSDDFAPLYRYYQYKDVRNDAERVLEDYAKDSESVTAYDMFDAYYRLTYYYDRLVLRTTFDTTQLNYDMSTANSLYGHAATSTDYTLRTWNEYLRAYNFCQNVYESAIFNLSTTLRQSMITTARLELKTAIKSLKDYVALADYSALNNLVVLATNKLNSAEVLNGEYMDDAVTNLRTVLTSALSVVAASYDCDDQQIVDDMYTELSAAISLPYKPAIDTVDGTLTNLDRTAKYITGLTPGFSSYTSFIELHGAGVINEYVNSNNGKGTGAKVELVVNEEILDSYTIVVYGDIDGDTYADATDANILSFYVNDYLLFSNTSSEGVAVNMASDVDNDSEVDTLDVYYLIRAGLYDSNYQIDQRGATAA